MQTACGFCKKVSNRTVPARGQAVTLQPTWCLRDACFLCSSKRHTGEAWHFSLLFAEEGKYTLHTYPRAEHEARAQLQSLAAEPLSARAC